MALEEYNKKRRFDKTPEPTGGEPEDDALHFVVQKHHATNLHYDFRLEMKGVMKSWAVPKGPSLNPDDHRLAMATEDHPMDYNHFEGIIPKGQYGGGTVIIWDNGTFTTPAEKKKDKKAQEHSLMQQYYKGELLIELHGEKLKGKFAMFKTPDRGENGWVMMKVKDRHASKTDVLKKDKSVVSGLTIEEMAGNPEAREWKSNRTDNTDEKALKKKAAKQGSNAQIKLVKKGNEAPMPTEVSPMNATLVKDIVNDDNWLYEVKWDGYRIVAFVKDGKVKLQSRGGLDYTSRYRVLVDELAALGVDVVLDGEVVVVDEKGQPNFDELQKYKGDKPLIYYVFDVLWVGGYDVTRLELVQRKKIVEKMLPVSGPVKVSTSFDDGEGLFELMNERGMEGIVAKRRNSLYKQPAGKQDRSKDWLKLTTSVKQEFVIGGWTESESGRPFRSLLFGAYDNQGKFLFVGHAGGGFKDAEMREIFEKLKKLEIKKKPFADEPDHSTTPHWVKPELVANCKYATFTASGKIRKPATFLGFRDDKEAKDVRLEVPAEAMENGELRMENEEKRIDNRKLKIEDGGKTGRKKTVVTETGEPSKATTAADSNWPELEAVPVTTELEVGIEGKPLKLTNVEKVIWSGITKADLIQYYNSVADYMLPYLVNRPLSLHIKHKSREEKGLYIKDMEGRQPEWAKVFTVERKHKKKGKRDFIDYLVCNDKATLLYVVNLGCIDINPWTSGITDYLHPDFIIIDLDPSDEDFKKAVTTAQAAKQYFDEHKLKAFAKTSGKTGIHLYLPCEGFTFPQARKIAEHICREVHELVPNITTTAVSINQRGDKLYVDPNQNDEADTVAAPYSARPFHHPSVSTPLEWKEIKETLHATDFDIHNIHERLAKKGDLFERALDKKIEKANAKVLVGLL